MHLMMMLIMVVVMVIRFSKVVAFALDQSAHYPFMLGATNIQRQVNVNDDENDKDNDVIYDDDNDEDHDHICDDVHCRFILRVTHDDHVYIDQHSSPHEMLILIMKFKTVNFYHKIQNCRF